MRFPRPLAVFDCNVLCQALTSTRGASAAALRLVHQGSIILFVSKPILRELRETLNYPELREKNPQITDEAIAEFIDHLRFRAVLLPRVRSVFKLNRDPDDEPYINLAAAAHADFIVSRDNDLLSLMTGHFAVAKEFRRRFPRLRVVKPPEFLSLATSSN